MSFGRVKGLFFKKRWLLNFVDASVLLDAKCFVLDEISVQGLKIYVDLSKREVIAHVIGPYDIVTAEHILLDFCLPKLLAHDGALVMHGALVDCSSGGLGIIGPSGFGKSTLTASMHARELSLISDDVMVIFKENNGFDAECLYPSLRLFPDSLESLLPQAGETAPMADYSNKRRVPFAEGPDRASLRSLFRLTEPAEEIRVARLPAAAACMAIIENTFAFAPDDAVETRRRLLQAAEVARVIPVYDLTYPRDYAALPEVHAAIFEALEWGKPN